MLKRPEAWQTAPLTLAFQTSVTLVVRLLALFAQKISPLDLRFPKNTRVPRPRRLADGVQVLADADVALATALNRRVGRARDGVVILGRDVTVLRWQCDVSLHHFHSAVRLRAPFITPRRASCSEFWCCGAQR